MKCRATAAVCNRPVETSSMWLKVLILAILVALATRIVQFINFLGPHRPIHKHWPGPCRGVAPITAGAEAIALSSDGLAFISSGYKTPSSKDERIRNSKGRVYLFDFNNPGSDATELTIEGDVTLGAPHGMSLWEDQQGIRIFLVNHLEPEPSAVEVFQFKKPATLEHIRTILSDKFISVNDIVATSRETFYATNECAVTNFMVKILTTVLGFRSGSLVYYDGAKCSYTGVTGGIFNGVTRSTDGRFIFISHMMDQSVMVLSREANGTLTPAGDIDLSTVSDNLFYDPATGDLFASCQNLIGFMRMIDDYDRKCPSHLLRIRPKGGNDNPFEEYDIVEVFADDGQLLSISSSAARFKNGLLLGSVMEKAAYCEIKYVND